MAQDFSDLRVYKESYELGREIYGLTKGLPKDELYGMVSQMRRAAVSIPLNIAEGHGRRASQATFANFVQMAIGSANELLVLLDYAKDFGYAREDRVAGISERYRALLKQLESLHKRLVNKLDNPRSDI